MYIKGKITEEMNREVPFDIVCNNCGSHNVTVVAFEDLEIECNNCGSYLIDGTYNPTTYNG